MFAAGSLLARAVSDSDRRKFLQVFEACDEGKKGCLSREDLKVAVVMLFGYKPSKIEVDTMVPGLSKTGGVRPDEFVTLMALKRSAQRSFGDQRQIFSVFDTHCRGFLNLDDFKRAFKRVSPLLPDQTIVETFREVDRDADGLVCYKDFEYAVSYDSAGKSAVANPHQYQPVWIRLADFLRIVCGPAALMSFIILQKIN